MNRALILKIFLTGFCLFLFSFSIPRAEQDGQTIPRRPFETKMTMGLFGLLGATTDYSMEGKKINSFREFKDIIFPLNDPEATRLIHESEETELVWWLLVGTGVAVGADIALTYKPVPFIHNDFIDRVVSGSVAVQIFMIPGAIVGAIGASDKFNAVQRYNQLVRGEKDAGLRFNPELFTSRDHLGLGLSCEF